MNFDQLWRMNLVAEQSPGHGNDEQEVPRDEVASEQPDELNLTPEDRTFLSQVGIKP
jgi:hypothetical protein